jgi:acetylornithine aminotransferase
MDHILRCHEIVTTDFKRGENCYLYDESGHQYIDFESGIWSAALGHNHPRINKVIKSQIEKVIHLGTRYPNMVSEEAALDVLDMVGIENGKCTFLSSGSEAVEFAVQVSRIISEKKQLLTFSNSYLSAYGSAGQKRTEEWTLLDWDANDSEGLEKVDFETIGAFVFEPGGSGSGLVKFPPKQLVQNIVKSVKQAGGLIVINEVTTGMGRTGKWFGYQHYDLQPDIVALGKGLGNGYPVSAVAMSINGAEELEKSGFTYAQSHQNDPLGCSVAREVITILREERLVERGEKLGVFFLEGLRRLKEKYNFVKEIRGRGLLLALEFSPHERITSRWAYQELFRNGFLVGYYPAGNILRFDPSLTIDKNDISRLLKCMDKVLKDAG